MGYKIKYNSDPGCTETVSSVFDSVTKLADLIPSESIII